MNKDVIKFVSDNVDQDRVKLAWKHMDIRRAPLSVVDDVLYDEIQDLLEEYGEDNDLPEGWWMADYDIDELVFEL